MQQAAPVVAIAHLIQLAIAPVFLLTGIGSILNVLTQRLARVVDRARWLEHEAGSLDEIEHDGAGTELKLLDRRMHVVNLALSCCTASALLVCILIAILFVADLADFPFGRTTAWLFILAMLMLIAGLILFLYEVRLAMAAIRLRRGRYTHLRRD